jgi:glyoxylase-like metal-dependent hydrolase (beta-lactamase superfamily II)
MTKNWRAMGIGGEFFYESMGRKFAWEGITLTPPTQTFDRELTVTVGSKDVRLVNVGPAHTAGDAIAFVPADRTVFTGDILFHRGHPIMWAGPVANWIAACDYLLGLDVDTIVPGHGPITDKHAVRDLRAYFVHVAAEARTRFDAGMTFEEAARDLRLENYRDWSDGERIVANVYALYREFDPQIETLGVPQIFDAMGRYRKEHAAA